MDIPSMPTPPDQSIGERVNQKKTTKQASSKACAFVKNTLASSVSNISRSQTIGQDTSVSVKKKDPLISDVAGQNIRPKDIQGYMRFRKNEAAAKQELKDRGFDPLDNWLICPANTHGQYTILMKRSDDVMYPPLTVHITSNTTIKDIVAHATSQSIDGEYEVIKNLMQGYARSRDNVDSATQELGSKNYDRLDNWLVCPHGEEGFAIVMKHSNNEISSFPVSKLDLLRTPNTLQSLATKARQLSLSGEHKIIASWPEYRTCSDTASAEKELNKLPSNDVIVWQSKDQTYYVSSKVEGKQKIDHTPMLLSHDKTSVSPPENERISAVIRDTVVDHKRQQIYKEISEEKSSSSIAKSMLTSESNIEKMVEELKSKVIHEIINTEQFWDIIDTMSREQQEYTYDNFEHLLLDDKSQTWAIAKKLGIDNNYVFDLWETIDIGNVKQKYDGGFEYRP